MNTKYVDLINQTFEFPQQEFMLEEDNLLFHGLKLSKLIEIYGTPLKFEEDGIVKLRVNGEFIVGTWEVYELNVGFGLRIIIDGRPNLNLEWQIKILDEKVIHLENENNELILKQQCPNDDEDLEYTNNILMEGEWEVAYFEEDEVNETEYFLEYVLNFKDTGSVLVERDNQYFSGSWLAFRYDGNLRLALNFGDNDPFFELNNRWKIVEITQNRIELIDYSNNGSIEKKLVFEQL